MQMEIKDLVTVSRAVELLYYGVDITKLDNLNQYYNAKIKSLQGRVSDNIVDFRVCYAPEVMSFIENCLGSNIIRKGSSFFEIFTDVLTEEEKALNCAEVGLDEFKKVMSLLRDKNFALFNNFNRYDYDTEYIAKMEAIRKSFDYSATPTCEMVAALDKESTRQNLEVMLQMSKYDYKIGEAVLKAFDKVNSDFGLKSLDKFPIIDNRMYIKLSPVDIEDLKNTYTQKNMNLPPDLEKIEYVVISRNPYDFYFCSQGSNIQSCYSLSSGHYGWYGFIPLSMFDGTYIIYGTTGKPNKINIINGVKWNVPRMLYRSWGWHSEDDKLMLDRVYIGNDADATIRKLINVWFEKTFLKYDIDFSNTDLNVKLKNSKDYHDFFKKYDLKFYPDSIKFYSNECKYRGVCGGERNFIGHNMPLETSLLNLLRSITSIDKDYHYCTKYGVICGVLKSCKSCPITGLPISDKEEKSEYAYLFNKPVSNVAVVTYVDGSFKLDTSSNMYCCDTYISYDASSEGELSRKNGDTFLFTQGFTSPSKIVNIKSFKETLTGAIKRCEKIDAVVVRFIEGDKVTYVKYGRK